MNKNNVIQIGIIILLFFSPSHGIAFSRIFPDKIERSNELSIVESVSPNKLSGSIWQMQMDENKDKGGVLKNISFGTKGIMIEVNVYYSDGYCTKVDKESSVIYRETPNGIIVFDNEGENPYFKKVKWLNDNQILYEGYIYARLGSDNDRFTSDYTEPYVERIVSSGGSVEAYFLQDIAIKYCSVVGNAYQLKGEPEDTDGYLNLEFRESGTCFWKKNKMFVLGYKDYNESRNLLRLRPHKPFADPNRNEWNEKWNLKWLNCREFVLSNDEKSYQYIYVGKASEGEKISN